MSFTLINSLIFSWFALIVSFHLIRREFILFATFFLLLWWLSNESFLWFILRASLLRFRFLLLPFVWFNKRWVISMTQHINVITYIIPKYPLFLVFFLGPPSLMRNFTWNKRSRISFINCLSVILALRNGRFRLVLLSSLSWEI